MVLVLVGGFAVLLVVCVGVLLPLALGLFKRRPANNYLLAVTPTVVLGSPTMPFYDQHPSRPGRRKPVVTTRPARAAERKARKEAEALTDENLAGALLLWRAFEDDLNT